MTNWHGQEASGTLAIINYQPSRLMRRDLFCAAVCSYLAMTLIYFHIEMVPTKATLLCVLLCLLWSLVEVQSQTEYPYITFRGNTLSNHSYVDLSQVGDDRSGRDNNTVQCHTDLSTCCTPHQGLHRGHWFAPGSDTRLPFPGEANNCTCMYENREDQVVHIGRRNNANGPSGIYRCVIATNAVRDDSDESVGETVYVGIYGNGGGKYRLSECTYTNLSEYACNIISVL